MLVLVDNDRIALALRNLDPDDFCRKASARLRRRRLFLASNRKPILVVAADLELLRDILPVLGIVSSP